MRVHIDFNEAYKDYCVQTASNPVRDPPYDPINGRYTPSDDGINTAVPNVPTGPVAPVPPVDPGKGGTNPTDPGILIDPSAPTTLKPGNGNTNNTDPSKPTVPGGLSGNGAFTAITGAPGIEYRWPVQDLASKYPDVFNMFILALEALQKMPETLELSYYQLAGIHGAPFQAWQYPQAQRVDWGYCTHKSVIFVNWHRPYLLLVEQTLVEHAVRLAKEFTGSDGDKYREAAKKVRLPYWDWSADNLRGRIPEVVSSPQISVIRPSGPQTIRNPLYSYVFQDNVMKVRDFDGFPQVNMTETLRTPLNITQQSRHDVINARLEATFDGRKLQTFQIFQINTFSHFSTARFPSPGLSPLEWNSVESIHDDVHATVGGRGHMSTVPVAAFDPIFWIHHTNVDRLGAMYQAINPGSNVEPLVQREPNFAFPNPGGIEDMNTKFYPFRHPNGQEFTSHDVSCADSIHKYGYAYPEVPSGKSGAELSQFTSKAVCALYAPKINTTNFRSMPGGGWERTEWLAHVTYDESQIDGTFKVSIYVGDVPASTDAKLTDKSVIGGCSSFSGTQKHNAQIAGTLPLTPTLVTKGVTPANKEEVVKYLKENMTWKILKGAEEVPLSQLPSLCVGVSAAPVQYFPQEGRLPTYGEWSTYYEATQDKVGGMKVTDSALVGSKNVVRVNGTDNGSATTLETPRKRPSYFSY
ncbi:common central domain of tyrosinase-domain-containing protein [Pyronema domesticum]|nr:common central domain of tyrosinase-domain-containing protein [Pyronema domesticum]